MADNSYGTGRRKKSRARVILKPGSGDMRINRRTLENYFPTASIRTRITEPLVLCEATEQFDITATASGGGVAGQAGALKLGIARALVRGRPGAAPAPQESRHAHARRAHQGAQEVTGSPARASGSSSASGNSPRMEAAWRL